MDAYLNADTLIVVMTMTIMILMTMMIQSLSALKNSLQGEEGFLNRSIAWPFPVKLDLVS